MNYTLNQLRIFQKIAETKSITKAAEELHLTQPAVSIQLKNFQEQFDLALTEVVGRQLYLTDFGRNIAEITAQILKSVNVLDHQTMTHKGQIIGRLKLSIVSTGKYVMPHFLADFLKQHPGVELQMDVTNKTKVLESLERNEVDFSLVSLLPSVPAVDSIQLMPNKLYLIASSDFSATNKKTTEKMLEQLPLIYREPGSGTRLVMERFLQKVDLSVRKKMELTSNEAVKQAVLAGLGLSIMPLIGIKNELMSGELRIVPLRKLPMKTNWHLIWPKNKKFSTAAGAYLKFISEEKDRIIKTRFDWLDEF